jgi:hypothetical protein
LRITNLNQCVRGWFIGDFPNTILRTKDFEVAFMKWEKGPFNDMHFQRKATEYNLVTKGSLKLNGKVYKEGDFFVFEPYVVCEGEWLEYTEVVVVKTPSCPDDKQVVECK